MSYTTARLYDKTYEVTSEDTTDVQSVFIDLVNSRLWSIQAVATDSNVDLVLYASNDKGQSWTPIDASTIAENDQYWIENDGFYTDLKIDIVSLDSNPASASLAVLVQGSAE